MQMRGTFPALNDHRTRGTKRKKPVEEPRQPGQSGFALRRQPSSHNRRNPKTLEGRRALSRALSKGRHNG